jgi:hypothetical protein
MNRSALLLLALLGVSRLALAEGPSDDLGRFRLVASASEAHRTGSPVAVRLQLASTPAGVGVAAVTLQLAWDAAALRWEGHRPGPQGSGGWSFVIVNDEESASGRVLVSAFSPENVSVASVVREFVFIPTAAGPHEVHGRIVTVGDELGRPHIGRFTLDTLRIQVEADGPRQR